MANNPLEMNESRTGTLIALYESTPCDSVINIRTARANTYTSRGLYELSSGNGMSFFSGLGQEMGMTGINPIFFAAQRGAEGENREGPQVKQN